MDRKRSFIARQKVSLSVEQLEDRTVPSIFTPTQIQEAYGFNQIAFSTSRGTIDGNGAGQTIAIVDAYDDPNIVSDLQTFDRAFGLPDPPSFTIMKQSGTIANSQWASETALDVEWAHAIAPRARILLGEARSNSLSDLVSEVDVVANQPGVSVVSMSWSASEWSSEADFDSNFTTPAGHQGVTYVASTGDDGAPPSWPAISPNVLSVGGTSLVVNANGSYKSETGWSGSGGGVSADEAKPVYQEFVSTGSSKRTDPDVAYDADPTTGLYVYNSYGGGNWIEVGGTSAGAPQWAALVAIADQGRALEGKTSLDGASQTLYAIYRMAQTSESTYFHDVTSGSNGYAAKVGYDDVTGNGSPVANMVVAGLVAWNGAGSWGYVGSVAVSASAASKKAAHTNDFAIPVAPPGEVAQFLAATPGVASVSFGESGYTPVGGQPQTISSTPAFTLANLETNEPNSRMRVPDRSIDETRSEWNWPFGPNIETIHSAVQTFASDGEVSADVTSDD
ncbi:MAG TPA: S53 family peptidase [Gemmata sp.]|jgi:subtilase family serine protease|nr:S53 family peptidase [Gemmata sp.]